MKRILIILFILLMGLSLAQAQHKPTSGLLILNVGFTKTSPEYSDQDLDGNTFTLSYEKSDYQGRFAGGIAFAYTETAADSLTASGQKVERANSVSHEVIPITLFGKVLFGPPKVKGYIGGGIGIQFSHVHYYNQNVQVNGQDSGLLVGGLAGLNYFLNDKIFLNGNYSLFYLGNSYYQDDLVQNFSFGLGFQIY